MNYYPNWLDNVNPTNGKWFPTKFLGIAKVSSAAGSSLSKSSKLLVSSSESRSGITGATA